MIFDELPEHYKRGLLFEANIRYKGHQLSKYNKLDTSEETRRKFIIETCSKLVPKAEHYHKIESNVLYSRPYLTDRLNYVKQKAKDYATLLDSAYLYKINSR